MGLSKNEVRKVIEQGMLSFKGEIKKAKPAGKKRGPSSKEEYVEIEVDALPEALKKYVVES